MPSGSPPSTAPPKKMQAMTPLEFEGLLRPVFKQEEWILILAGAVLGGLVGEGQLLGMMYLGLLN